MTISLPVRPNTWQLLPKSLFIAPTCRRMIFPLKFPNISSIFPRARLSDPSSSPISDTRKIWNVRRVALYNRLSKRSPSSGGSSGCYYMGIEKIVEYRCTRPFECCLMPWNNVSTTSLLFLSTHDSNCYIYFRRTKIIKYRCTRLLTSNREESKSWYIYIYSLLLENWSYRISNTASSLLFINQIFPLPKF